MGRPLSVFRPRLCLLSALVGAVPFHLSAVPVGCACWPCLLSVPLVRARGGGTFLSFGRACWLCLLAMSVVCASCPRSWRRHLSIFRPRLLSVPVGHVCCLCLLSALVGAVPRLPPARRSLGWHIEAPRRQILLRVPQTRRPPDHTPTHRAGRSSGSAVPNLIEQGCDAHHDMRTPAPLGHPALFGCASVCPCFALRHQLRRRQRFTPKSSGRNSQRGSTAAPGSHAQ